MKNQKKQQPKHEAIMTLIREWESSTLPEISKKTGYSIFTLRKWVSELRKIQQSLPDKRKAYNWQQYGKENADVLGKTEALA